MLIAAEAGESAHP